MARQPAALCPMHTNAPVSPFYHQLSRHDGRFASPGHRPVIWHPGHVCYSIWPLSVLPAAYRGFEEVHELLQGGFPQLPGFGVQAARQVGAQHLWNVPRILGCCCTQGFRSPQRPCAHKALGSGLGWKRCWYFRCALWPGARQLMLMSLPGCLCWRPALQAAAAWVWSPDHARSSLLVSPGVMPIQS